MTIEQLYNLAKSKGRENYSVKILVDNDSSYISSKEKIPIESAEWKWANKSKQLLIDLSVFS